MAEWVLNRWHAPELIALSTGVTDYEHPYWVAARIDVGTEKTLLQAAAIDPSIPKMAVFRAALAARHDALAAEIGKELPWDVELGRGLAAVYRRLGDLEVAASYYERVDDARSMSEVRALIALRAKNDARRPVVSDALEQDRLVRQRVTR